MMSAVDGFCRYGLLRTLALFMCSRLERHLENLVSAWNSEPGLSPDSAIAPTR